MSGSRVTEAVRNKINDVAESKRMVVANIGK
jgi:hypothetical protein